MLYLNNYIWQFLKFTRVGFTAEIWLKRMTVNKCDLKDTGITFLRLHFRQIKILLCIVCTFLDKT